jgi:hypothetical protein
MWMKRASGKSDSSSEIRTEWNGFFSDTLAGREPDLFHETRERVAPRFDLRLADEARLLVEQKIPRRVREDEPLQRGVLDQAQERKLILVRFVGS